MSNETDYLSTFFYQLNYNSTLFQNSCLEKQQTDKVVVSNIRNNVTSFQLIQPSVYLSWSVANS